MHGVNYQILRPFLIIVSFLIMAEAGCVTPHKATPPPLPLLGLAIETNETGGAFRLVEIGDGFRQVVHRGSRRSCEHKRLELLKERHGSGNCSMACSSRCRYFGGVIESHQTLPAARSSRV